jgi:hypothetical protein
LAAFGRARAPQPDIAQLGIALTLLGCINDALSDHFENDCRLSLVVKLHLGDAVVKNDPGG